MTRNPAGIALGVVGALLLLIGGVIALVLKGVAEGDANNAAALNDYAKALGDGSATTAGPDYTGAVIALVFASIGALMLIGLLVALAARPRQS